MRETLLEVVYLLTARPFDMPTREHLIAVARQLKTRLNGKAFLTVPRRDVTELLRDVSGEDTTRIKSVIGENLDQALLERGVRSFPRFADTSTSDMIRLFHADTVAPNLLDLFLYPSPQTDHELAEVLTKVKGKWKWSTPIGPAAMVDQAAETAGADVGGS